MTPERSAELRARITLADTIFLTYGRARIIIPSLDFPNTNEREFW